MGDITRAPAGEMLVPTDENLSSSTSAENSNVGNGVVEHPFLKTCQIDSFNFKYLFITYRTSTYSVTYF